MVVLAARDRRGEEGAGCVDRLEDAAKMGAAGDFLDEDRCETLRTQLLVDDEEINLRAALRPVQERGISADCSTRERCSDARITDAQIEWNARDEADELARLSDADADVPVGEVARRFQRPARSRVSGGALHEE